MEVENIVILIGNQRVEMKFDTFRFLSELREILVDQRLISSDEENEVWRFVDVRFANEVMLQKNFEWTTRVCDFEDDDNKVRMVKEKVPVEKELVIFVNNFREYIKFDLGRKLRELRNYLIGERYISNDNETQAWRFVSPTVEDWSGDLSEAIVGTDGSEPYITVKEFLHGSNKVRMVNIKREKPDLIGVGVNYLSAGNLQVRVQLNYKNTPDKFQPVMMENVREANKDANKANFVNVVLCENETAITFNIAVQDHGGFAFSVKPREGDVIADSVYALQLYTKLSAYANTGNAIKVVSYKDLDIPAKQQIGHRRVTITAWKLISYKRDGKYFSIDNNNAKTISYGIDVVPGDIIEGGAFQKGDSLGGHLGTISDVVEDRDDVFGTVEIDFFVFKSKDDAQNMIESRIG